MFLAFLASEFVVRTIRNLSKLGRGRDSFSKVLNNFFGSSGDHVESPFDVVKQTSLSKPEARDGQGMRDVFSDTMNI